jgi:hypothetical protein
MGLNFDIILWLQFLWITLKSKKKMPMIKYQKIKCKINLELILKSSYNFLQSI